MPLGGNIDTEPWGEEGSNYLFVYKTINSIYCTVFYMAFLILVVWDSVLIIMHSVYGLILCTCIYLSLLNSMYSFRGVVLCTIFKILCEKLYCNFIYGINMQQLSYLYFIFILKVRSHTCSFNAHVCLVHCNCDDTWSKFILGMKGVRFKIFMKGFY